MAENINEKNFATAEQNDHPTIATDGTSPDAESSASSATRHEQAKKEHQKEGVTNVQAEEGDADVHETKLPHPDHEGRVELSEDAGWNSTAYAWSTGKKWWVLSVIFLVQVSMNFNTSVWPNALDSVETIFGVSQQGARTTQMIFLVFYAFGCELWAPFSEEFGRRPILQLSLFLVNVWQILGAFAPNFGSLLVARALGGVCTAGGSVTLGMVADLYDVDNQQYAVAFIVLSSVGGTSIGPVIGGYLEQYAPYRWIFWTQLIFGGAVQIIHFFTVPETRATCMLDKEAKRRRKAGETHIYGPNELKENRFTLSEFGSYVIRPFEMFVREPIVLSMSLLSGFSDALIFTFLEAFTPVFEQWGFSPGQLGLAYIPINLGYLIGFLLFLPVCHRQRVIRRTKGNDALLPEARLWLLLFLAPLEPIGLFGFAWTSLGPPQVHWIAPMIFACLIAIANYAIYMATIDYMIAAYGPYSASATGGNGLARDFLAGISAMYAGPLYTNLPKYPLEYASTILACIGVLVMIPVYVLYIKGPIVRKKSKFAQTLAAGRKERHSRREKPERNLENDHAEMPHKLEAAPSGGFEEEETGVRNPYTIKL
ncbi:major facilitator superfamily transporter [Microstroma glucosiphilum]|uniref:Major facilitator superfamily transporter n=1 Tax=Pseudomicrostroma glucosiphilum TaxID=1684307 RepID=A0A316U3R8_9BASI|nr:major facilitator superfamily transporter [Pseudomicrostroma glucosiphilum]PWN19458.1 major facilitator superfamily transporter [Pseudomicrostroma glucosiphilum]